MSEWPPAAIADLLRARVREGPLPDVLVLPSKVRSGIAYYSEFDIDAVKIARQSNVSSEFLDIASTRRYLSEHSAGAGVLAFAMGVAQELTADLLKSIGSYVLAHIRAAQARRLVSEAPKVTIDAAKIRRTKDDVEIEGLHIEGVGDEAVTKLLLALGDALSARAALAELGIQDGPSTALEDPGGGVDRAV